MNVTSEMVEAALDVAGHRSTEYSRKWMRKALEAALASPVGQIAEGEATHRHLKSGHIITETARGHAQVSSRPIEEMSPVVIYQHDGNWWVRHADEFEDGRFEVLPVALSAAPAPPATGWQTDGPEEIEIDRLRLAAFKTNSNEDKAAYYLAVSKWFQDRHIRALEGQQ